MRIKSWNLQAAAVLVILGAVLSGCTQASGGHAAPAAKTQVSAVAVSEKAAPIPSQTGQESAHGIQAAAVAADKPAAALDPKKGSEVKWTPSVHYDLPVIDFVDTQTGFAMKEMGDATLRLLTTADGGAHWQERKVSGEYVRSLDFVNAQTGYVLIEEQCSESGKLQCKQIRLLKTRDGGRTWNTVWQAVSKEDRSRANPVLHRLSFVDENNGAMLVNGSLYITEDGGVHFKAASFGVKDFKALSASFPKAGIGYVIGTVGKNEGKLAVLKTANGGRTWSKQLDLPGKDSPLSAFQIQFANENAGWLLTNDTGMMNGDVYRTLDGGKHWSYMSTQRTGRPYVDGIQLIDGNTGMVSLHPGAGPIEGGIWLTRDGGRTFTGVGTVTAVNQLQMLSAKEAWAAVDGMNGSDVLIHSQDGGISWQESYPLSDPYGRPTEDTTFIDPQNGYGIGTQINGNQVLKTTDGGANWKIIASLKSWIRLEKASFVNEKLGYIVALQEKDPQHVLLMTNDGGMTWGKASGDGLSKLDLFDIYDIRFFDREHGVLFGLGDGKSVYRTSDGGKTWTQTLLSREPGKDMKVALTSYTDGWLLQQGDTKGQLELIRFKDGITSTVSRLKRDWFPAGIYFTDERHGYLLCNDFHANDGYGYHLLTTADGGKTWTDHPVSAKTELDDANRIYFADPLHGWLQSYEGTAETKDGGLSWTVLE